MQPNKRTFFVFVILTVSLSLSACMVRLYSGTEIEATRQSRQKTQNAPFTETPQADLSSVKEIQKIVQTGRTVEIVETETTTTNNCASSTPTEIQTQRTRTVEHLIIIEGQGGVIADVDVDKIPFLKSLKVNLEGKYGVQNKETELRTYIIKFSTGPNKLASHRVDWKYTWYSGEAIIRTPDGTEQVYRYKVRTLLEPETTSIEQDCP